MCAAILPTRAIVPIAFQSPKDSCPSVSSVVPRFTFAFTKASIDAAELSAIMASDAPRTRIEIFGVLASRLGLIGVALDHLDSPYDEDFTGIAALKESIAFAEWNFRLIHFNNSFQRFAIRSNIDRRSFCVSSQAVL